MGKKGAQKKIKTQSSKKISAKRKNQIKLPHSENPVIKKNLSLKKQAERIKTGIPGLDRLIENGFVKNSMNLVMGGSGTGKSIFGIQFLIEGIKQGEKCLYITFEEKKEAFFDNMRKLGLNLEELEKQEKFIFLEYAPEKVKTMLEEGGGTIETIILTKKVSRVVIDSMTAFAMLFEEEHEKRVATLSLFNMLRKWSCTVVVTYEKDFLVEKKSPRILEFESDSIILLYSFRDKKIRERYLEIIKMRGTNHAKKIYLFNIEKSGINIENKIFNGSLPFSS